MRKRAKVDSNQAEIVEAMRKAGWQVVSLAALGGGVPDLLCAKGLAVKLIEVKSATGHLTPWQVRFHQGWPVQVVRTVEDALAL